MIGPEIITNILFFKYFAETAVRLLGQRSSAAVIREVMLARYTSSPLYNLVRSSMRSQRDPWGSGLNTDFDFHDGEDIETLARKSKKKKEKFSREFHRNHFMFCSLYALSSLSRFCLATF